MSLKLIIDKEFENPLLNRKQIYFRILHQKLPTPTKLETRKKLAAQFNADLDKVIISKLAPKYGQELTVGYAKIYDSIEAAVKIEQPYILKRNKPKEEK
ncbi:MAG: 30S ribosomal protein S24e [Candidatus Helarchaeota archaeon]